jgi:hypothetical protein
MIQASQRNTPFNTVRGHSCDDHVPDLPFLPLFISSLPPRRPLLESSAFKFDPKFDRHSTLENADKTEPDPIIAGAFAWLIPGAGHAYLGMVKRGGVYFSCMVLLFGFGVILGAWEPVPDRSWVYPEQGDPPPVSIVSPRNHPVIFGIQALAGLPTLAVAAVNKTHKVDSPTIISDLGQVIAMIVGALNLLLIVDAFCLAHTYGERATA